MNAPAGGPVRGPKVGTVLRGDYDPHVAVVVSSADVNVLDALREAVASEYGGEWSRENPVLAEVAAGLRIECWHSCSKAWREGEGVADEWTSDWWAPHGDGKRFCYVLVYPGSLYDLGEQAEPVEPLRAANARSGEAQS